MRHALATVFLFFFFFVFFSVPPPSKLTSTVILKPFAHIYSRSHYAFLETRRMEFYNVMALQSCNIGTIPFINIQYKYERMKEPRWIRFDIICHERLL